MYNMPVRQKLVREAIDVESVRMRLESFALMHPKVAFSLRNDRTNAMVIQTKKSSGILATFLQLFGVERAQGMAEVHHTVGHFTVSGYIGTQPHLTKALQFVYINKRIFLKTKIHRLLNDLLARSSVISARLHPSSVGPTRTTSSPPKGMRLYGMFVLNIECPYTEYDICLDPAKTLVEFKDWNQILLCIEELVIQFANEENLVINLDERFRRSGKEQEEGEEEQEENLSQSSQSRLQVFSLKRSCEGSKEDEGPGPAKQRYGRTLNTQDNLLAIHSAMVRRVRKEDKGRKGDTDDNDNNKETTQHTTDKKDDNTDTPDKDDSIADTMKKKVKKKYNEDDNGDETTLQIHQKDMQGDTTRCIDATPESIDKKQQNHNYSVSHSLTNLNKLNDTEKNNSENEHITESSESEENVYTKRKKGVWSVLDEFKKVLEEINERDDTTESDLDQTITTTQSSNTQQKEDSGRNRKTGDKNKDRVKSNPSTLATLEEFMNANNREEGNSFVDEYKTPEEDVRGTPITPPPLKSHRPSSPTPSVGKDESYTRRIQQGSTHLEKKCSCDTKKTKTNERHIERRVTRHSNKVSLSKSLSEKLKTRQNMSRNIPSLQRFGYCKTNTNTTQNVQQTQGNIICGERERSSNSNKTRSSIEVSGECPRVNTHTETTEDKGSSRTGKCHEGFKFDPVITKTFQGVDTCLAHMRLAHMRSCGENEPPINIPLDNNNTIDAQYRTVEKINHKPIVSTSEVEKCVDVSSGNGVSILTQLSTPPRQTNSLLHIAQNYASTPEDSDDSPEKSNTSKTILKVPPFQGFEENLTHPQTTSSRFPGETCNVVNSSDKCTSSEGVNVTGRRSEGGSTYVESEGSTLVKELIIDTDTLLQTDAVNIFLTKSNLYSDKTLSVYEKEDSMQPIEEGETQFKVSQNIDPCIALYNAPVTQSLKVIDSVTQREDHREREEVEEDLQEYVCPLQPSQGFKPSSIEPLRIQRMDASIENKLGVLTCPQHIQETADSIRVCSGDVKTQETTREEGIEIMSGSKVLESLSQLSEREVHLENTLPLVSQMNMEKTLASICKPPPPDASLTLETQPLPQPLSPPQEGVGSEVEEKGSQPPSQTSTDPFSDSLHFSQLTLPDEVGSAASLGAGACTSLDTLPTSTTLSVAFPFTYQSSVCGNSDPPRSKMSSCDLTAGNMKESEEGSVEISTSYSTDCDVGTVPSIPDTTQASHNTTNAIFEPMQTLPLPSLPPVQSVDGSAENTKICPDPPLHKDTKSCEESNKPKGVGSITNQGLNNGINPSCQNTAGQTEVTACETPLDPQKYRWREAKDKEGRTVYVDLQTGNSSYEPLEVKNGPEWTSSQPLGAPLPKLPLTHEPWYIPRVRGSGSVHKDRDSFTLSHGFTELMSWKKTIQMRKKESVGQGSTDGNTNSTPAGMPQEVKVALESVLEDSEADNNFVKWTEKPDDLQELVQPSDVAQICQMWEPPDFAMDGEVLNSGLDAGAGGRGGSGVRVYNMVHPYRFTQDMLHSCKVRGFVTDCVDGSVRNDYVTSHLLA